MREEEEINRKRNILNRLAKQKKVTVGRKGRKKREQVQR